MLALGADWAVVFDHSRGGRLIWLQHLKWNSWTGVAGWCEFSSIARFFLTCNGGNCIFALRSWMLKRKWGSMFSWNLRKLGRQWTKGMNIHWNFLPSCWTTLSALATTLPSTSSMQHFYWISRQMFPLTLRLYKLLITLNSVTFIRRGGYNWQSGPPQKKNPRKKKMAICSLYQWGPTD